MKNKAIKLTSCSNYLLCSALQSRTEQISKSMLLFLKILQALHGCLQLMSWDIG